MKRWLWLAPLAIALLAASAVVGWMMDRQRAERDPVALEGLMLPEVVLPILTDGRAGPGMVDLKTAAVGKPMLLNVFASWCGPCRIEHPHLLALQAKGIKVVGVAVRDEPAATVAWLTELGDPYALVLVDRQGQTQPALNLPGPPATYAVDARGRVVAVHEGPLVNAGDIDRMVAALHAAPPAPR